MARYILRRLAVIPPALLLVHFFAFAYAQLVRPAQLASNPYSAGSGVSTVPWLPAYWSYLRGLLRLDLGVLPGREETVASAVLQATEATLGLLTVALLLSAVIGLLLGLIATRPEPPSISPWLTSLSTVGLAMPSFYLGSLLILGMFAYMIWGFGDHVPLPIQGFGWDSHLVLPTLVLMIRPTAQLAQVTAGLLTEEFAKQYVVTARSVGHPWHVIRRKHALRNILAPVVLTAFGSFRLLMGELVVVEWLFYWPGLGRLLAWTLVPSASSQPAQHSFFLNPPLLAAVITVVAALFLITDLVASGLVRALDPRLHSSSEGTAHG